MTFFKIFFIGMAFISATYISVGQAMENRIDDLRQWKKNSGDPSLCARALATMELRGDFAEWSVGTLHSERNDVLRGGVISKKGRLFTLAHEPNRSADFRIYRHDFDHPENTHSLSTLVPRGIIPQDGHRELSCLSNNERYSVFTFISVHEPNPEISFFVFDLESGSFVGGVTVAGIFLLSKSIAISDDGQYLGAGISELNNESSFRFFKLGDNQRYEHLTSTPNFHPPGGLSSSLEFFSNRGAPAFAMAYVDNNNSTLHQDIVEFNGKVASWHTNPPVNGKEKTITRIVPMPSGKGVFFLSFFSKEEELNYRRARIHLSFEDGNFQELAWPSEFEESLFTSIGYTSNGHWAFLDNSLPHGHVFITLADGKTATPIWQTKIKGELFVLPQVYRDIGVAVSGPRVINNNAETFITEEGRIVSIFGGDRISYAAVSKARIVPIEK